MFYAGIDVGSRSTEAVILSHGRLYAYGIVDTGVSGGRAAEAALKIALKKGKLGRASLTAVTATGYGRKQVSPATARITEITCHARGAFHLFPETRTVIDIGGQDSKVIRIDEAGHVVDFAMNDRCAAGTGRFLEVMAKVLEMDLRELGAVSHDPGRAAVISNLCTVFAESEVISLLAEGRAVEEIVCGLQTSVAERTVALFKRIAAVPPVIMTGGVANNRGVVQALEAGLKVSLQVPEMPQIVGALGAALAAQKLP
ncbi:MAG: 2-hydroxyglutaryl-CoA dehydratase [Deltaproteobacteria bacterium]|nr:2-hydroxyglutaryl-CoA dehydratase [Deltaproteobacteria bacterium]